MAVAEIESDWSEAHQHFRTRRGSAAGEIREADGDAAAITKRTACS